MADAIISRKDAKAQGLKRYFTGVPCLHGHVRERSVIDGKCVVCVAKRTAVRSRRWAELNPEKVKDKTQRWRAKNTDAWRASNRRSKQSQQKIYNERQRQDYALNPEKYRVVERRRRAQMAGSGGTHTAADLAEILSAQNYRCAYCKIDLKRAKKHVDHIKPLALGGSNGRENLQYLCQPCNQSKSARDPIAFAQSRGLLI